MMELNNIKDWIQNDRFIVDLNAIKGFEKDYRESNSDAMMQYLRNEHQPLKIHTNVMDMTCSFDKRIIPILDDWWEQGFGTFKYLPLFMSKPLYMLCFLHCQSEIILFWFVSGGIRDVSMFEFRQMISKFNHALQQFQWNTRFSPFDWEVINAWNHYHSLKCITDLMC